MAAEARAYEPPYVSEIIREIDGTLNDCTLCAGISFAAAATLGEILDKPDGTRRNVIDMREQRVRVLGPGKAEGGLTLADLDRFLKSFDPEFTVDRYPGHGGTLRVSFETFWSRIQNGYVGILLGDPSRVPNPMSPLRTKQDSDRYKHAILVFQAQAQRARVYDALTGNRPDWRGEWVSKGDLREFSEAFGVPNAIGCALAKVGSQTREARTEEKLRALVSAGTKRNLELQSQVASLTARIEQLEEVQPPSLDAFKSDLKVFIDQYPA